MPLAQRLPKLGGFHNRFKKVYAIVNLSRLSRFPDGSTVDPEVLVGAGLADAGREIKVLAAGKFGRQLNVAAHAFSAGARAAIEARGGTVILLGAPAAEEAAREPEGATAGTPDVSAEAQQEPVQE